VKAPDFKKLEEEERAKAEEEERTREERKKAMERERLQERKRRWAEEEERERQEETKRIQEERAQAEEEIRSIIAEKALIWRELGEKKGQKRLLRQKIRAIEEQTREEAERRRKAMKSLKYQEQLVDLQKVGEYQGQRSGEIGDLDLEYKRLKEQRRGLKKRRSELNCRQGQCERRR
jgi:hypothetical protein